ncbi:MAG: hypothetical protein KIT80_11515 [Chitinophagaceae bacterium]|nr:hypothetical protein [Chitinophagaceae bacterium]MCW5927530.1 hypothetical protein [Chitinophagaceae bacterium]
MIHSKPKLKFVFILLFILILFGCKKEGADLIGKVFQVSCSTGKTEAIDGQIFDMRPHNNCGGGSGALLYSETVVSESGKIKATFQIGCGAGFCISGVKVLKWKKN